MSPREESLLKGARRLARLERTNLAAALTATLFHDHLQIAVWLTTGKPNQQSARKIEGRFA
jgi:hypothetical protein